MIMPFVFATALIIYGIVSMVEARQLRDDRWMKLANEIGADFIKGGFPRSSKVQAHIKEWTIILDTYFMPSGGGDSTSMGTRMRARFQNKDGLQFMLSRRGLISKLDKVLGAGEIEIGDTEIDRGFYIKGSNEAKVRSVFANMRIRKLIEEQRPIRLGINNNELVFEAQGLITNVDRLKSLFELFKEMLNQLKERA